MNRGRASFLVLAVVVVVALGVGSRTERSDTPAARSDRIAASVRCPTCAGLSAAESESPASLAIRAEIRRRVDAGESDAAVRRYLAGRYGRDIVLEPEGRGVGALVWALPVMAFVAAAAGLAAAFRRWRPPADTPVSDEDRRLVEEALGR